MKKKILVVDDEEAIRNSLKKFLTKKEYEVDTASCGEEGIEKVGKEKFFAVLLDIKMPGMGGADTLKKMKEIDKEVSVIMITAVKDDEIGKRCMELGASDYITKPLGLQYLENVLMMKLLDVKK